MELNMTERDDFLQPLLDLMNGRMDRIEGKIDANTSTTNKVLTQAKYTNGRVTKLEKQMADQKAEKTAKKFSLPPSVIYLIALGAVILLVIVAALLKVPLGGLLQ